MKVAWQTKHLQEVCSTFADGDWVESKDQSPVGIRLIQTGNIGEGEFKHRSEKARYISGETFKRLRCTEIFPGDCLISRLPDPVGRSCIVADTGERMITAVDCSIIRFNPQLLPKFFIYYSQSDDYLTQVAKRCTGATRNRISRSNLGSVPVPVPPLSEQERIVDVLNEAFEGIAAAKANVEKSRENTQLLFGAVFEAATRPSDKSAWQHTKVKDIAANEKGSIRTGPFGSQLLHSEFVDHGVAVLGIDNVVNNEFVWAKKRFITEEKYKQLARYRVKSGDVLITIMGTCGRCAVVPDDIPVAINTKHLCCITLDRNKCLPEYLQAYFLYHPVAREYLASRAKGAIMAGLNMEIIKELPVVLPSVEVQAVTIKKLKAAGEKTRCLECVFGRKLKALESLKKSVLHEAFSGNL